LCWMINARRKRNSTYRRGNFECCLSHHRQDFFP
jgi:hypothetical protein